MKLCDYQLRRKRPKVLSFGSLNIDFVYRVDHFVRAGETLAAGDRAVFSGGKGLNQSVAMARAGMEVFHAGCIGAEGGFLAEELSRAGVDTSLITVLPDMATGHAVIQNNKEGDNCILLYGGANREITREQIDRAAARFVPGDLCVLQNEINNLAYIIDVCHDRGLTVVLNPSPMDAGVPGLPLEKVACFFVNEVEASLLTGEDPTDEEALAAGMQKRFPHAAVVLTLGGRGAMYLSAEEQIRQQAFRVTPVDTTAAGDTFTGYFLAGITEGMPPAEALKLAAKAAAISVTRPGAAPSVPLRAEVDSREDLC